MPCTMEGNMFFIPAFATHVNNAVLKYELYLSPTNTRSFASPIYPISFTAFTDIGRSSAFLVFL